MKVSLAISSYNGDDQALALAVAASSGALSADFHAVCVIDSGAPERCERLQSRLSEAVPSVDYIRFDGNLGSAGNLVARLGWAQETGADAVLALNADGLLVPENHEVMVDCLERSDAAVVYPTHLMPHARVDVAVIHAVPVLPMRRRISRFRDQSALRVRWGSSNGALYRVEPLATLDLGRIARLWYGWEDLAIGLGLQDAGHMQLMCLGAAQATTADQKRLPGTHIMMSDKAPWTTYYATRNLGLLADLFPDHSRRIRARLVREFAAILARDARGERYRFAFRGVRDARRGVDGFQLQPVPAATTRNSA